MISKYFQNQNHSSRNMKMKSLKMDRQDYTKNDESRA